MKNLDCTRCGTKDESAQEVTLLDGYVAYICRHCRNDWHRLVIPGDLEVFSDYFSCRESLQVALTCLTGQNSQFSMRTLESLQALSKMLRQAQAALFDYAEKWANTRIERADKG